MAQYSTKGVNSMKIRKVGVVGCGFMGAGIVQVCAQSGYEVVVTDISEQILSKGMVTIEYYLNRGVEKGRISQQDRDLTVSRIKRSLAQEDLNDRDLVIEAVPEDMELKRRVFVGLDEICPTHTILCSNTSCLPITELARATRRPACTGGSSGRGTPRRRPRRCVPASGRDRKSVV